MRRTLPPVSGLFPAERSRPSSPSRAEPAPSGTGSRPPAIDGRHPTLALLLPLLVFGLIALWAAALGPPDGTASDLPRTVEPTIARQRLAAARARAHRQEELRLRALQLEEERERDRVMARLRERELEEQLARERRSSSRVLDAVRADAERERSLRDELERQRDRARLERAELARRQEAARRWSLDLRHWMGPAITLTQGFAEALDERSRSPRVPWVECQPYRAAVREAIDRRSPAPDVLFEPLLGRALSALSEAARACDPARPFAFSERIRVALVRLRDLERAVVGRRSDLLDETRGVDSGLPPELDRPSDRRPSSAAPRAPKARVGASLGDSPRSAPAGQSGGPPG